MNKPLTIALLACTVASCATVPATLQGQFAASTPRDAHGTTRSAETPAATKQIGPARRPRIVHLCRCHSIGNGFIRSCNDIVEL